MSGNLFIKYTGADTGTRPIPANTPFWISPSIWLSNPGNTVATVGIDNPVFVQVDRIGGGSDSTGAYVQAWVCKSTTQPGPSGAVLASAGGAGGLSAVTNGNTPYPQTVFMDWTPVSGDVSTNQYHHCVAVNVYMYGGEGVELTSGFIDPVKDQHQGQLNISIVLAPMGQKHIPYYFRVPAYTFNNLAVKPAQKSLIKVATVGPDTALSSVIKEQLLRSPLIELVKARPTAKATMPARGLTEPRERIMLRAGGELVLAKSEKRTRLFASERGLREIRIVAEGTSKREQVVQPRFGVTVPMMAVLELPEDTAGAVYEFDITQTAADGRVLGGIRVVIVRGYQWW